MTLPKDALFKRNYIYTLDSENRVQKKAVIVLHTDGATAWVKGDLKAGEAIVLGKQSYLSEGIVVAPVPVKELVAEG